MPQARKMIFTKSLTDTDTRKRLAIPIKILPDLPDFNGSHALKIHLMHGTKLWPIVCSVRKNGYKKAVFSRGWRNFVICNNLNVGDKLTVYKMDDEAGSSHYMVEVEKPMIKSIGGLSPPAISLKHDDDDDDDETTGTSGTQILSFEDEQEQLLNSVDAPVEEEGGAIMEVADVVADEPVAVIDHIITKPSCWIFGANLSDESSTGKAHFKTEIQETEPPFHSYPTTEKEREIKFFGLVEGGAMAYGTNKAAGAPCCKSSVERLSLQDMVEGQAISYAKEMDLNLTLAPPIVDGAQEAQVSLPDVQNKYSPYVIATSVIAK